MSIPAKAPASPNYYIKADGAGTSGDPAIPHHKSTVIELPDGTLAAMEPVTTDLDSGAGSVDALVVAIGVPGDGAPTIIGTPENPVPVSIESGDVVVASLPAGSLAGAAASTADYHEGAGVDTVVQVGLVKPGASGRVAIGDSNPLPVQINGGNPQQVTGSVADGAADSGNSVKVAGVAISDLNDVTANDDGDRVPIRVSPFGEIYCYLSRAITSAKDSIAVLTFGLDDDAAAASDSETNTHMAFVKRICGRLTTIIAAVGAPGDAAAASDTASASQVSFLKRLCQKLTAGLNVFPTPTTSGGLQVSRTVSASGTNATVAKSSAGQVYGYKVSNIADTPAYLHIYNKATAPTVGTDTPLETILIPGGGTRGVLAHFDQSHGAEYSAGISYAITTSPLHTGSTGVNAGEVVVNLLYK